MSERPAHSPCLRTLGCIFTRNHSGYCSTFSPSSVPVPRPSEPLPCPFCASAPKLEGPWLNGTWEVACPDGCATISGATKADAIVLWNRRSPSVPTAIQVEACAEPCGDCKDECAAAKPDPKFDAFAEPGTSPRCAATEPVGDGLFVCHLAAGHAGNHKCWGDVGGHEWVSSSLVLRGSEEAANSDTDQSAGEIIVNRDEWYAAKKDAERMNWLESKVDHQAADAYLRLEFDTHKTLREAADDERPAARVQGENSQ